MAFDVIILAAGQGTRMCSSMPKVLHTLAGKPMLTHTIESAQQLGAERIHVVIGHGAEQVKQHYTDYDVHWCVQHKQLGTGHAVAQALPEVNDNNTVLIMYGDVPLLKTDTLDKLIKAAASGCLSLLTVVLDNPTGYGRIVRDAKSCIKSIVEQKDATSEQLAINEVNTGIMAVSAQHLCRWLPKLNADNAQSEYYLTDIIAMAVNEGVSVVAQQPASPWEVQGVNNRQQLSELERYYQIGLAKQLMRDGATLADPARIDIRGNVKAGKDIFIDVNCVFIGDVNIADNVSVGPNCVIENATIGQGSSIKANTVIENAVVGEHCDVGPFARLRPNTVMAKGSRVGNFVELKNTKLGSSSKVNHLAYVGDSTIGQQSNIGAGTITCNYDGVNKFKTTMGNNVFIGSNSTLVAPITIEDRGFVGAGSIVTKDVPSDNLAIGRGKQKNIEGWIRPVKKQD